MKTATPNRHLRIAVLSRAFCATGGGAERYSVALVEQLAGRHEIHVYAQEIQHSLPTVQYHRVSRPLTKPRWVNQLWFATVTWWVTRSGFDIVHSHENTWHGNVQTVHVLPVKHTLFKNLTGWRRVLRTVKVVTSPRLLAYLALEALRMWPWPGRKIIATSPALQTIVTASYPACVPILSVVMPGVDAVDHAFRKKTAGSDFRLLFVANDMRRKGLQCLLEAMSLRQDAPWSLTIVGSLGQAPQFKAVARSLGISEKVHFLGPMADVSLAYQAADCLVHPTQEDTFAMVVLEAMSHGVPVIASSGVYCGISALLEDGEQALLLQNPHDATALCQTIGKLASTATLQDQLALAGKAFAADFTWKAIALRQEAIYFAVSDLSLAKPSR